jgi:hypothetical protein
MKDAIVKRIEKTVVVFAMDVVPQTVFEGIDANCLIRYYLDSGGRIIWIGDVPFWHIGRPGYSSISAYIADKQREKDLLWYSKGAHIAILGVNPVVRTASSELIRITQYGKTLGLKQKWSGVRPIEVVRQIGCRLWSHNIKLLIKKGIAHPKTISIGNIPKDRGLTVLAKSKYLTARPVILVKKRSRLQTVDISLSPRISIARDEGEEEGKPEEREFWKTYANAWFKNFNREKPFSGFVRLWDYVPRFLTRTHFEDLLDIAIYGLEI